MIKKQRKKGFTLIELIVVMAVIGVLVLLGIPKFMGYTQKAKITEIKNNIRQLENASERYYINTEEWPRLTDEPYTAEEIEAYSKEIKDRTGFEVKLDPEGKYYPISYSKLQKYVQKPKNQFQYIIQNPVGEVFYIDDLTPKGKEYVENIKIIEDKVDPGDSCSKAFEGLDASFFDSDLSTYTVVNSSNKVTLKCNLDNKALTIVTKSYITYSNFYIYFKDANGNTLNFIDLKDSKYKNVVDTPSSSMVTHKVIVPKGAVSLAFGLRDAGDALIYGIYLDENDLVSPNNITNITSTSNDTSITLNWEQNDSDYSKVAIFRDGSLLGLFSGKTYTDKPLHSERQYTYEIQAIDSNGNASSERVVHTEKTTRAPILFSGLDAASFDKDTDTYVTVNTSNKVTWTGDLENKALNIVTRSYISYSNLYLYFKDANGNTLSFIDLNNNKYTNVVDTPSSAIKTHKVIVPKGAVAITFGLRDAGAAIVHDIYVDGTDLDVPNKVTNVTSTSEDTSVTLSWQQNDADYSKVAIFRNGTFLGLFSGKTYTDKPLMPDTSYAYKIVAIDSAGNASEEVIHTEKTTRPPVIFSGLGTNAFDKDTDTYVTVNTSNKITWTGDLENKALNIVTRSYISYSNLYLYFKDAGGNTLSFIDLNNNKYTNVVDTPNSAIKTHKVIVPKGAVAITFGLRDAGAAIVHDIYIDKTDVISPNKVTNVTSTSNATSVTLSWEQNDGDYDKVAIFRNGTFLGLFSGKTYTNTGLTAGTQYAYEIQAIDKTGNASEKFTHVVSTK